MTNDPPDTTLVIHRIKQEIDVLALLQIEALETATYVGMLPHEISEYDRRLERISQLIAQLKSLNGF